MDRTQLLFGVAVLMLVTILSFDNPLVGQVGNITVSSVPLSDRERLGLRGPVKTCSVFVENGSDPTEMEYTADGRLLVWRGNLSTGKVERVYSYDGAGRLIGVTGGGADVTDEFHYDQQGKKTRVRTVPPRPGRQNSLMGLGSIELMYDIAEEGDGLSNGGTVTTRYNDDDQPIESLVRNTQGLLLMRITHNYSNGRLVSGTLVRENLDLPTEFGEGPSGEQLSDKELRTIRAKMMEMLGQKGLARTEKSYFYDKDGRIARRVMQSGDEHQEIITTYNEHGDEAGTVQIESCFDHLPDDPKLAHLDKCRSEVRYLYEYDSHSNWIEQTIDGSSSVTRRKITYY
ncbi:MAG TPA: hypothetical protein VK788_16695 [Terriglobales bacterium]|jgi:YD repeat-containing protein|nr:hypothetical protein [Terriglobales bacterium]